MEKYEDIKEIEGYPKIPVGKAKNITGQKFNKLTALYRVQKNSNISHWLCQCDCGNYCVVGIGNLSNGHTKSCGCLNGDSKIKNLKGKVFGKLKVLEYAGRDENNRALWWVKCSCGGSNSLFKAKSSCLVNGDTKSCGCLKHLIKDVTNQQFGYLKAIQPIGKNKNNRETVWQCYCTNCGTKVNVAISNLVNGHTKSCGCIKSFGEQRIKKLLNANKITFKAEKKFEDCVFVETKQQARFDFYLPDYNYLIEYDGEQHFISRNNGWNTQEHFEKLKQHDAYKNQWCQENNIPLIRIPYTRLKDLCIEDLLLETTKYRVV